ncbi:MAG: BON domain-containing protein [Rhodocyclaceae bacterium]|nr:BON domain-containing protein [Rhodocyclaceae bacterium]MBX3670513.1 BON domain-containing protein [Rhodocyclaceae bacterium]
MKRIQPYLLATALGLLPPLLAGCFPVVATGVASGALMIADRRSTGAYVDDEAIEWKVEDKIKARFGDRAHVNATSYNRTVLLTGEVPDQAARDEAGRLAGEISNVKGIVNELRATGVSSLSERSNDTYITSKVKARFLDSQRFSVNAVKVVTEAGVCYLLGIVTQGEADAATEVARTTSGVLKVVRVFEIVSGDTARQLDTRPAEQKTSGSPAK